MSEEEKKAVDLLNKLNFSCNSYYIVENGLAKDIDYILTRNAIKTIKNLIEKQQKEIEEKQDDINVLEAQKMSLKFQLDNLKEKSIQYDKTVEKLQKNTIWKSKIQERIYELENFTLLTVAQRNEVSYAIGILKELLEEE